MPELPEVETICRGLEQNIISKKILSIQTSDKNLRLPFPKNFADLESQKIISVVRRARYILIEVSSLYLGESSLRQQTMGVHNKILLIHLGMSGKVLTKEKLPTKLEKHDHFVIKFSDGSCLIYNDPRRFGLVDLVEKTKITEHKMIKNLGPEPLSDEFNEKYLAEKLKGKKLNIKTTMMDNAIVVGVGNIYINESLFESKISPTRDAGSLNLKELEILVANIKKILQKAIKLGGSTLRDYVKSNGDVGGFQFDFKVYGREGQDCLISAGKIKKIKQNGRSSFYCSNCQK